MIQPKEKKVTSIMKTAFQFEYPLLHDFFFTWFAQCCAIANNVMTVKCETNTGQAVYPKGGGFAEQLMY